jgi:hypothetical protein
MFSWHILLLVALLFLVFVYWFMLTSAGSSKRGARLRCLWRAPKSYCAEQKMTNMDLRVPENDEVTCFVFERFRV